MKACPRCQSNEHVKLVGGMYWWVECTCENEQGELLPCVEGPWCKTKEDAVALWDALPRQEDYEPLFDAFDKLNNWCAAYPESVFPPYSTDELAAINALLKEHGYSLDCLSAGVAQHMVGVVSEIVREAMKVKNPGVYHDNG